VTLEVRKQGTIETRAPVRERARAHLVARRVAVVAVSRRWAWTGWQVGKQAPGILLPLMLGWSWRGAGRLLAAWGRYVRDDATAELRSYHASERLAKELVSVANERRAERSERMLRSFTAVALAAAPVLAWTVPGWCGALVGVLVFVWTLHLIPGRKLGEVAAGLFAGAVAGLAAWWFAPYLPVPPAWVFWTAGTFGLIGLGWVGRPRERPLVTLETGSVVPPLTVPMVSAALCSLGNSKMREPDDIRPLFDVGRDSHGYQVDVELPSSVPASWVIEHREELAAALRRELGCVWPAVGARHPGHLSLFVSHVPMATARQAPWPLARGVAVNLFAAIPLFTDQRGQWVKQALAYTAWIIGAVPRMGKTMALRIFGLIAAFDVRAKLYVFDLKGTGDLSSLAQVAHAYSVGDEPEDVEVQLRHMRAVREEMRSRTRRVRELTLEENPDRGKVTDALATADPRRFGPIVVLVDECQVWFQEFSEPLPGDMFEPDLDGDGRGPRPPKDPGKAVREEFIAICRDLVKRGPALGIIPLFATQKPDAKSIPSSIADNASARLCFKVNGQISNDQILGTSSYQSGVRATQFAFSDKGIAYFRGDGAEPLVVRTVFGIDAAEADKLGARARAMRAAAGLLTGDADDVEDAIVVLDVWADVQRVLADRGLMAAQHAELVEWLREMRLDYARLDVDELSTRLRNRDIVISQVKRNGRNLQGVDLRKQSTGNDGPSPYLEAL
jgi:S-DNA-T family DNA segregation ATPase FtsK/SpoIIIE